MKYYAGLDLGGTFVKGGIVDEEGNILVKDKIPTGKERPYEEIAKDMAELAAELAKRANVPAGALAAAGIGSPGLIDSGKGIVVYNNNLGWKKADLAGEFRKHWDIPVRIANDADCAALAESIAGAAKDYDNVLMLTLGTGVGGSFVMNKKIYLGGNGYGCEPGHTTLVFNGVQCTCGRRGCLEAYASVTALIRETIEMMAACPTSLMCEICGGNMSRVNGRTAFDAAKQGDEAALQVVHNYVEYLAAGIGSLVTAFRPTVVILGGGLSNEGEYLLGPVRRRVSETVYASDLMDPPAILKATLGNDAGIIGAALLGA